MRVEPRLEVFDGVGRDAGAGLRIRSAPRGTVRHPLGLFPRALDFPLQLLAHRRRFRMGAAASPHRAAFAFDDVR
jgi:hypothetical protein